MNLKLLSTAMLSLGLALGSSAYAQGRHDDKPHGMPKKVAKKADAKKEAPAKKDEAKKEAGAGKK